MPNTDANRNKKVRDRRERRTEFIRFKRFFYGLIIIIVIL